MTRPIPSAATLAALALATCALSQVSCARPVRFFPRGGFVEGSLRHRRPVAVQMFFGEESPPCEVVPLGVLVYDAARDHRTTSQSVILDAFQARAARMGASGVYKISFLGSGVSSSGAAIGGAVFVSSMQEYSASGTAYVCAEELRGAGYFPR